MTDIDKEILKRLIALRKECDLTQEQVAKKIGISRRYINKLENRHIKDLGFVMVLNYLDACKVNYGEFFGNLEKDISKAHFKNVVSKVNLPSDYRLRKKVSRDIELYHTKIKGKIGKAIPLSQESRDKAVIKFGNYRTKIETVQSLAYKIIAKHAPSTTLNPFYRAFVNEIYKELKKRYSQHSGASRFGGSHPHPFFQNIIQKWVYKGLKEEILIEIKDVIIKYFEPVKQG